MQFLGAIAAAGLVSALLPGALQAENSLSGGATIVQGVFLEMLLTAELIMTIIMLAVEKSRTSFMAPLAIGLALFIAHLIGTRLQFLAHHFTTLGSMTDLYRIGINYTGTSVNPARTLGPAVVNLHFVSEIWIFFVGPTLGALLAAALYHLLKAMGYESANPGQDDDGLDTFRIVHAPQREVRPIASRPPRPRRSSFNLSNDYYNNYLQELTSPRPVKSQNSLRF